MILIAFPYFQADFWQISCLLSWVLLRGKICLHHSTCQNWKCNTKYDNVISSRCPLIIAHKTQQEFSCEHSRISTQKQVLLDGDFIQSYNSSGTRKLVHLFLQQILIECLLCFRCGSRPWTYYGEQGRHPSWKARERGSDKLKKHSHAQMWWQIERKTDWEQSIVIGRGWGCQVQEELYQLWCFDGKHQKTRPKLA